MPRRKILRRPRSKVGVPPGTLIHVGEKRREQVRIDCFRYHEHRLEEDVLPSFDLCPRRDPSAVTWINVEGLHETGTIEATGECFGLHPLVQEDILNTEHRPKFEDYDDYLFLVLKMLRLEKGEICTEQVSLILGPDFVLSFQEGAEGDLFDGVRERLRAGKGRIRKAGADFLAYALIDAVVDGFYPILEEIGDRIELLEDELVDCPTKETLQKIHAYKRELLLLRKSVWPLREVVASLQRQEEPLVREGTRIFLRDVYDHIIQVADTLETYRDILAGLLDLYLSSLSNRMNEVMKVLTIIATLFIPLTFLVGVYGMNFTYMPELEWRWGYPAVWGIMIAVTAGMLVFFKKKKWF